MTYVDTYFRHPLIMNMLMFSGEAVLLLALAYQLSKNPIAAAKHQKNAINPMIFAAPAFLDTLGSFLNFSGLMLMSSSTFYIMRMLCMVFVVLLSVTVLRRQYSMLQYLGIGAIISGLVFFTVMDALNSSQTMLSQLSSSQHHTRDKHALILGMLALLGG